MENRKGFNFYRSYYDVAKELPKEDRLDFLMAILEMQFTGEEPELSGMAKFAFISQRHSIIRQIEGYKSGINGGRPPKGTPNPPLKGTPNQVQVQEQEQEQVQEKDEVEDEAIRSIKEIVIDYKNNERLINALLTSKEKLFSSRSDINQKLDIFVESLKLKDITTKKDLDFKSHFLNWVRIKKKNQQNNQSTSTLTQTPIER